MRGVRLITLLFVTVACSSIVGQVQSLERIKALPEMTVRARQALEFAATRLETATQAYKADGVEEGRRALDDVGTAVELAVESLEATGKNPRRNPRHFKSAEIRTRRLLRQIQQVRDRALTVDQPDFDRLIDRVEAANGKLLLGIMSQKG